MLHATGVLTFRT